MDDKVKKLPWGLKAESLAPSSMKTLPDTKLKAFQMGRNPLKATKVQSKLKDEEKKKAEEAATAEVYAEYIESFQESTAVGKSFVRGNVINASDDPNEKSVHKYQKNTSKLAELAEEFKKTKEQTHVNSKSELKKRKEKEKKKSNLELFKEELERSQKEREIRHKIKKGDISSIPESVLSSLPVNFFNSSGNAHSSNRNKDRDLQRTDDDDDFSYRYGSLDCGDPNTTNLYIGNINPKMSEEQLCRLFGKFGPLASVKIMWPRTDEEKARNRNCGFVAFMNRADGERALNELAGKDVFDYEMRLGWGKCVPIPPQPYYVPPEMLEAQKPPPQSGLPFNAQVSLKYQRDNQPFDGNIENTIVKVVIPMERSQISIIHRMIEFVAREGPMFEAMIMNKELNNPMYRFLFDNKSYEHIYYRWRLFSILQGDTPQKWSEKEFRMFNGGSIWRPPPMNRYSMASLQSATSTTVVSSQPKQENIPLVKKESLSDSQRDKLEDFLRTITTERKTIGELMIWCIDHANHASEIVECITESLSLIETPIQTKIARLYVTSDILHNSGAKAHLASHFRREFESKLLDIMKHLRSALMSLTSKSQAEKFRKQVLSCLAAWQDWSLYPSGFLVNLQNIFVGLSDKKSSDMDVSNSANNDGNLMAKDEDDVDGIPLNSNDDYLDGFPLIKKEDLDGVPIGEADNHDRDQAKSRWESVKMVDTEENQISRWEKDEVQTSKWENNDNERKSKWIKETTAHSKWQQVDESTEKMASKTSKSDQQTDELRRKLLRDVELKVIKYADKLEASGLSKSQRAFQDELMKYRRHLIEDYDREKRKKSKYKRRERSCSISPSRRQHRNETSPKRKRLHSKSPTSLASSSTSSSSSNESSDDVKRYRSRRKSHSRSSSPINSKRNSKKKRKKTRK